MEQVPSWLSDHFWCNTCSRVCPKLPWWNEMWTDSVFILGQEFVAGKCQWCGTVNISLKLKEGK